VRIFVNGVARDVSNRLTVQGLLAELGVQSAHVAVEVNRELVPRSRRADHQLAADDAVEVVTLVGGG